MADDRSPTGWLVSALGAIVLLVSVFLPWYAVGLTARGVSFVEHITTEQVLRFGNSALQSQLGNVQSHLGALAGRTLGSVSAHQAFSTISVLLLIAGGLGVLIALLPLAREGRASEFDGTGPWLALLGGMAALLVCYRIAVRPTFADYLSLSLREGAWLALLGSLMMIAGGLWPRSLSDGGRASEAKVEGAWSDLSGWTPSA